MPRFKFIVFVAMFSASICQAGSPIQFIDGTPEWQEKVQRYGRGRSTDTAADSVRAFLFDNGFLESRVEENDADSSGQLRVAFGSRFRIDKIIISGEIQDTVYPVGQFERENPGEILDSVVASYQEKGHYFASLLLEKTTRNGELISLQFSARLGPAVTISAVNMEGLKRTRASFLSRYFSVGAGDTLRPGRLMAVYPAFRNLEFLMAEAPPKIAADPGFQTAAVTYRFSEKSPFLFEGSGGYVGDAERRFSFYLNLQARNMLGGGQSATIMIDSREKDRAILKAGYGQPLFRPWRGKLTVAVQTRDYRKQFYEFGIGVGYAGELSARWQFLTDIGWKNVEPANITERAFQTYEAGAGIRNNAIEELRLSRAQFALDWNIKFSGRRYRAADNDTALSKATYNDTRTEFRLEAVVPLNRTVMPYARLVVRDVESSQEFLPVAALYFIGGAGSLRGFRNDQFLAQRLATATFEPRLFVAAADFLYPFFDLCLFDRYVTDAEGKLRRDDDFKWGYGLGMKLVSSAAAVRLEFSWSEEVSAGDPRIHISLTGAF